MAEISFTFGADSEVHSDEYPELLVRISPTFLIACMLNSMIYAAYHVLSHNRFWSLAYEGLNDYDHDHDYVKTFQDDDICCICQDEFSHSSNDSNELCAPILLRPCAHIVGDKCFRHWIASFNDTRHAGGMRCPYRSQPLSRKPQALYRQIVRMITPSIAAIRSINFALLRFSGEERYSTEQYRARTQQRGRLYARFGMHCVKTGLWLFDALTALLVLADALRVVGGTTYLSDILA